MKSNTIAVLPFVNMGADPQHEFFSDGITVAIINALAQIEGLKVTSRTSSFAFKGKSLSIREIASQLKVGVMLEGSVRTAGNQVRISAQLLQAEDDFHFWSETWDRKLENIFELEDEISLLIADKLREQLGHFELEDQLVKKQTESLDAYTLSLKARYHFNHWSPDEVQKAIALYEEALLLDPNHVESLAGLADAYGFLATIEFMPRDEGWARASAYIQQAFELGPNHAGVHYQLANLVFFVDCDFQSAYQHAQRAVQLMPNYAEAQQFMAFLHIISMQFPVAKKHLDIAFEIDPLSQETLFFSAYYHFRVGKVKKALSQVDDCLENNPHNIPAYVLKSYCLIDLGRLEEALTFVQAMPDSISVEGDKLGLQCLIYHKLGKRSMRKLFLPNLKPWQKSPTPIRPIPTSGSPMPSEAKLIWPLHGWKRCLRLNLRCCC
ncbi:MAG: CDC27 family protein [Bacteroidia bacterium]